MKCSIQQGEADLNGLFHLSPNENICYIAQMRKHLLFILFYLYKGSNCYTNSKEKALQNKFNSSKIQGESQKTCNNNEEGNKR